jgi:bifunctional aspartokinase / homoserine dehydrogenase 1
MTAPVPPPRPVILGLLGPGQVGLALLRQIQTHGGPRFRFMALANSRGMRLMPPGTLGFHDPVAVAEALANDPAATAPEGEATLPDPERMGRHLVEAARAVGGIPVLLETSASPLPAEHYATWLGMGVHLATPNKHAGAGPLSRWKAMVRAAGQAGTLWRYEATVGAGLPVIASLQDLLATGDRLTGVEGSLSGTLTYLLSEWSRGVPFSESIPRAQALGYTEPDPREDLSGMDVARKVVILAREAGFPLELSEVRVESLVPASLAAGSVEDFLGRLPELDTLLGARLESLRAEGGAGAVLRVLGRFSSEGGATVGPVAIGPTHPFASLGTIESGVRFTTTRYARYPLAIQGPGAGPEVTAAGVFADLLRIVAEAR